MGNKYTVLRSQSRSEDADRFNYTFFVGSMTEDQIRRQILDPMDAVVEVARMRKKGEPLEIPYYGYQPCVDTQTIQISGMKESIFNKIYGARWRVKIVPADSPLERINRARRADMHSAVIG